RQPARAPALPQGVGSAGTVTSFVGQASSLPGDWQAGSLPHGGDQPMDVLAGLRAAMAEVDAFYKERGIFQERFGFGKRPALVVIDMAYGWTDPAYAGGSARLDPAVAALQRLLPAARGKGVPVFYTTSATSAPGIKSAADYSPKFRPW